MNVEQSLEDYLEAILVLGENGGDVHQVDVARKLGVSQPAVTKAVRRMKEQGYVRADGMHICLTKEGRERADGIYARHRAVCAFLIALGVDPVNAECDACRIEHIICDETYAAIKNFLEKQ